MLLHFSPLWKAMSVAYPVPVGYGFMMSDSIALTINTQNVSKY